MSFPFHKEIMGKKNLILHCVKPLMYNSDIVRGGFFLYSPKEGRKISSAKLKP